jgi:hypothetical protein
LWLKCSIFCHHRCIRKIINSFPRNFLLGVRSNNFCIFLVSADVGISAASKEELITLAQDLQSELASMVRNYSGDRDRLKAAIIQNEEQQSIFQAANKTSTMGHQQIAPLRQALNQQLQQNQMLRAKLQKIHMDSEITDFKMVTNIPAYFWTLFSII